MPLTSLAAALLLATSQLASPSSHADVAAAPDGFAPEHGKAATADPSPVGARVLEAELGYAPTWNNRGGGAGFDRSAPGHEHAFSASLTYGLADDVDVHVSGAFATVYDAGHPHDGGPAALRGSGLGDTAFGARWRFLSVEERALEVAAIAGAVAPSGASGSATRIGISQEYWSARGALVASKDLGRFTSNLEVGLEAPVSGDAGGLRSLLQANGAVGFHVAEWLQPELELNYEAAVGLDAQVLAVTAGLVAPFGDGHRLVAAVQQGVWGRHTGQTTAGIFSVKSAF